MMIGWEAQLWLQHCLESGVLEDPAVDYLAERVDEMDAAALLEAMGLIRKRLAEIEAQEGTDEGERSRRTAASSFRTASTRKSACGPS